MEFRTINVIFTGRQMKKIFVALVCAVLAMSVNATAQEAAQSVIQLDSEAVAVSQDAPVEDTGVVAPPAAEAAPAAQMVPAPNVIVGGVASPCCGQVAPMTYTAAPMTYAPAQGCSSCGQAAPMTYTAAPMSYAPAQACCGQAAPAPCGCNTCAPAPVNDCCCDTGRTRRFGSRLRTGRLASRRSSDCCCN